MFGDLTTVSLFFSRGWDDVTRRGDADVRRRDRPAHLRRRHLADRDQEPDPRPVVRGHHRGRIPQQSVPPGALRRPGSRARLLPSNPSATRARAPAMPSRCARATSCRTARRYRATTASTPTPGTSSRTPPRSRTRTRSTTTGPSTSTTASTRRMRPSSTRTCSRAQNFQNFLARDKELATMTEPHARLRRRLRVQVAAVLVPQPRVAQPALRPHPVRLRRLPRHLRTTGFAPGTEPLLQFRRERHPPVLLRLVLEKGDAHLFPGTSPFKGTSAGKGSVPFATAARGPSNRALFPPR